MRLRALAMVSLIAVLGCAVGEDRECLVAADCASGVCLVNGRCAAPQSSDAATVGDSGTERDDFGNVARDARIDPDTGMGRDADSIDATTGRDADPVDARAPRDSGTVMCLPNHDGTIALAETSIGPGQTAPFLVATDVDVDTTGTTENSGARLWRLPAGLPGDRRVIVSSESLGGKWYERVFPSASYASRLSERSDEIGVFEVTNNALLLLGIVSPSDGATRTELEFDPPVTVLSFPLTVGHRWTTDAHVTGLYMGLVSNYFEFYESEVDASGRLETPFGTFPVLRVKTAMNRVVGFIVTVVHEFAFASECFGVVGTVVSQYNETVEEFTDAAEVRRFSP